MLHPTGSDVFDTNPSEVRGGKAAARHARKNAKDQRRLSQQPKPLVAKTERQAEYLDLLKAGESIIAIGGAGTGKTYLATRIAAQRLLRGDIDKIIVARATVSKPKHRQGFLPGKLGEKLAPWMIPIIDALRAEVSAQQLETWKNEGRYEIAPFETMRGRTFARAVVILDEGQNCDWSDLKTFITRTGEDTQVIVTGDLDQIDIPDSGLEDFVTMVEQYDLPMDIVEFGPEDVVRSPFTRAFVKAYSTFRPGRRFTPIPVANLDTQPAFLDNGLKLQAAG